MKAKVKRIVIASGVYVDIDGCAFSRLIDGQWTDKDYAVYLPWSKVGYKRKVRIVVEVLSPRLPRRTKP